MNKFAKLKAVNRLLVKIADFSGDIDVDYVSSGDDIAAHKNGYDKVKKLLKGIIGGQPFRQHWAASQRRLDKPPLQMYLKTADGDVLNRQGWQWKVKQALAKKDADKLFDLQPYAYHVVTGAKKPIHMKDIADPYGDSLFQPQDFDKMYDYERSLKIRNMLLAAQNLYAQQRKKQAPLQKQIDKIRAQYDKRRRNLRQQ